MEIVGSITGDDSNKDLRAALASTADAGFVPAWLDAFCGLLQARRGGANIELGFAARFPRFAVGSGCHGPDFPRRLADAAVALEPFVDLLRKP
jgi:hypothetical protein